MTVTPEERAEWRREAVTVREMFSRGTSDSIDAGRILRLLDALEAAEAERDRIIARIETVIAANDINLARSGAASYTGIGSEILRRALKGPSDD